MKESYPRKPVVTAIGAALVGSLSTADLANALDQPFKLTPLAQGYFQVASTDSEARCGANKGAKEGQCGGDKAMREGQCGEGKCGGSMTTGQASAPATDPATAPAKGMPEGMCGEGKCGGNMTSGQAAKPGQGTP